MRDGAGVGVLLVSIVFWPKYGLMIVFGAMDKQVLV